jgi:hypothetical protein
VETLARFRPDLTLLAELSDIQGEDDFIALGSVPSDWFEGRSMGSASMAGQYANIYATGWVSHLRQTLARLAVELDLRDIDTATLQRDLPRAFTQHASYEVWLVGLDGIYYRSRYGHNLENWALFEPFQLTNLASASLNLIDPDLELALKILGLQIVD